MQPNVPVYLVYGGLLLLLIAALVIWQVARRAARNKLPGATPAPPSAPPSEIRPGEAVAPPVAKPPRPELKVVPPEPEAAPAPPQKALREGLEKTRGGFIARIGGLLGKKQIDGQLVDQLEEVLYTADIGARTSAKLLDAVRASLSRNELKDARAVWSVIRKQSEDILTAAASAGSIDVARARPFVILTIGVNGVGKTTTIGKLAALFARQGKRVLLAAGDTFRAAATEQLEIWGGRVGAPVVKGKEGGDPSSVIFDAVKRAQAEQYDVVLADTAGRLHTKANLMEELQKVRRVMKKAQPDAPHETLLVLDSTNGQNAIQQAALFKQAMDITGIVLTKLDGTAKGGVILGICDELKVPVRFVGIGERVEDLRAFDPAEFVHALYDDAESAA